MLDSRGRKIEYLRLSITERCGLKCIYCREKNCAVSEKSVQEELTFEEIGRIMRAMTALGVNKVRLTGGEPLIRSDLEQIAAAISESGAIRDLCMTTNAQGLAKRAKALHASGIMRLNISVDSLNEEKYRQISRGGELSEVLRGIEASIQCGFAPVKLNTVVVRGVNDDEIDAFIDLARRFPVYVRFIELMPFGRIGREEKNRVSNAELLATRPYLRRMEPEYYGQPSEDYTADGFVGRVGFISPMSHRFCADCNRIRVTSDGKLKPCLGSNVEIPLRDAMAQGDQTLLETIRQAIWNKPEGHHFERRFDSARSMDKIGG